jgi:hypothetical protein
VDPLYTGAGAPTRRIEGAVVLALGLTVDIADGLDAWGTNCGAGSSVRFAGGSIEGTASCVVEAVTAVGVDAAAKRTVEAPASFWAAAGRVNAIISPTAPNKWGETRSRRIGGLHAWGNARKSVTAGERCQRRGMVHAAFLIVKVNRTTCGQLDE